MSRADGIHLVQRLMNAEYADEAEADETITALVRAALACWAASRPSDGAQ
ncbi:hypothetical protein ACFCXS_08675 [Streptomyces sp. NPDC056373]